MIVPLANDRNLSTLPPISPRCGAAGCSASATIRDAMIEVEGLSKRFGALVAVDNVSLTVRPGEVLGFLGPNGAGKTTTMRMVAGFLEPSAGRAVVCGHDVAHDPISAKRAIGYLPEGAPLYGDMTPREFLSFIAAVRGLRGAAAEAQIARACEMVALNEVLGQPIETLSKGFKRRVGLAQAMLHDPPVLILDEPTDGLDPNQKHQVRDLIRGMAPNKAIIVSTHILEEVDAVCTRAVIIARGRVVADGTADALLARLPEHNAVSCEVDAAAATAARTALHRLGNGTVAEEALAGGGVRFRLPASNGADRLVEVTAELEAAGVRPRSLAVQRGRLDEMFRLVTGGASEVVRA
jgi:ABC-2 type transport system ATP-binding protein